MTLETAYAALVVLVWMMWVGATLLVLSHLPMTLPSKWWEEA